MSRFIDFTLPSTVPGRTLHGFRCVPEGQVRAVLQLSHGMVEYIDRYRPLAEYLADRGILVTGHDHLGHGASIRTKEDYGYFAEPDGNRAVLADLHAVTVLTKELRTSMHLDTDTKLEIFVDGDAIVLKKHRPAGSCDFCGEVDEQAIQFGGYCICSACRRKLSAL